MFKNSKILIVCSHFDDEVIGCSSLMKYNPSILVIFGNDKRKNLKHKNIKYLNFKPFENIKENKLNLIIQKEIEKINPDYIFTQNKDDFNLDHQRVNRGVHIACKQNRYNYKGLFEFAVEQEIQANLFLEISKKDKIKYLNKYKDFINPKNFDFIINYNEFCGLKNNLKFAEPFKICYLKNF